MARGLVKSPDLVAPYVTLPKVNFLLVTSMDCSRLSCLLLTTLLSVGGCRPGLNQDVAPEQPTENLADSTPVAEIFSDRTAATGLDFMHDNGGSGQLYMPEIMGPGVALLDYDNDGDLDLYLVQGGSLAGEGSAEPGSGDRLYRNDLTLDADAVPTQHWTDVTVESGLAALERGYGMGVATGDFDNDGWIDLYLTRLGANRLLRNQGGVFADVTRETATGEERWSVSATFVDVDRDGWLDLFVGNYVDFSIAQHRPCYSENGSVDYCGPLAFTPHPDRLFRNRGDGTFEDISRSSGITRAFGGALGVVATDVNGDGWLDLYVANDMMANQLWINQAGAGGAVAFIDQALLAGSALNSEGQAESGMGVDAADVDGDGDEDLFVSHLTRQTNTLYRSDGTGSFQDASLRSGLGSPSWSFTGFGAAFLDLENDGWLDLVVVNGAVKTIPELAAGEQLPLHQTNQLFRNLGPNATNGSVRFEDLSAASGAFGSLSEISRGAAVGDLDNDGDADLVVSQTAGPARVWINEVGQDRPWLGLRLLDAEGRRDALGARATLLRSGREPLVRHVRTGGSYASARDPRVLFGLGDLEQVDRIRVEWLDGTVEEWPGPGVNRYFNLRQGTGEPRPESSPSEASP